MTIKLKNLVWILLVVVFAGLSSCGSSRKASGGGSKASSARMASELGQASYYNDNLSGNKTASGERYNKNKLTAAHKTLPFGTKVKVTNLTNGKSVTVIINDRGPYKRGRIIDLSREAARQIDLIKAGVAKVKIEYVKP